MKVALVYDRINKFGGAERILLSLHQLFPQAPLFTAVYNPKTAPWAKHFKVIPSFLQNFPFAKTHHELYPWLTPLAFESFNFDQFDVVISITSADAKGIITKPTTFHLCYCLTPTRYLWSGHDDYLKNPQFGALNPLIKTLTPPILKRLKNWDKIASQRPDYYLAISKNVQQRIKNYYQKSSQVIYPPVDFKTFSRSVKDPKKHPAKKPFYLIVSRLIHYKRVDLAIKAFNHLKLPLKIVGSGASEKDLRKVSGKNIKFLGQLTDKELIYYYQTCSAVIFPQEEDLGLVPLEAQAAGKPVIAYRGGGALETIIPGKTGEFFYPQTAEALFETVKKFNSENYNPIECQKNSSQFDQKKFIKIFKKTIEKSWKNFQN